MIKLLLTSSFIMVSACSDFNKSVGLKDDGPIEEHIEQVIKEETGVVIDFTPEETTEKKQK